MTSSTVWAVDGDQAVRWAKLLAESVPHGSHVAFDLETTGLRPHGLPGDEVAPAVTMLTASGYVAEPYSEPDVLNLVVPLWHPSSGVRSFWTEVLGAVVDELANAPLAAQNGIFDLTWIRAHTGRRLPLAFDTEIAGRLQDENRSNTLESLAATLLGAPTWKADMDFSKRRSDQTDLWQLGEYAADDTYWTLLVSEHLRRTLSDKHLRLLGTMCKALPALVEMQCNGIRLDTLAAQRELIEAEDEHVRLLDELAAMWPDVQGTPSASGSSRWFLSVMDASVAAGESVVKERTPKGVPSWTDSTLGRQEGSRTAELVRSARDAQKRAGFITSWFGFIADDGIIHPSYRVTSTVTGRLSSASPNVQQVARSQKHLFVPPPGHYIVDVDYSQLELRIIAHMAQSEPMIRAFCNGDDLHLLLAAALTGKDPEDITVPERQFGKTINFELGFGGSAYKLQMIARDHNVLMTEDQAQVAYRTYLDTWELDDWRRTVASWVESEGQVDSLVGRTRHLADKVWSNNRKLQGEGFRQALNAPVQGFGCDLGLIGATLLCDRMPSDYLLAGMVHDSFQGYAPQDRALAYLDMKLAYLTAGVYTVLDERFGVQLRVPIAAEGFVETAWGEPIKGTKRTMEYIPEEMRTT